MTEEQTFLLAIWGKAYSSPEPLEIDCKSAAGAIQFRMALYNAAKPVKKSPDRYPEHAKAVVNCMVTLKERAGEKRIVVVKPRMMADLMQIAAGQLDIPLPKDQEQAELAQAAERLQRLTSSPAGQLPVMKPGAANPYYKDGER